MKFFNLFAGTVLPTRRIDESFEGFAERPIVRRRALYDACPSPGICGGPYCFLRRIAQECAFGKRTKKSEHRGHRESIVLSRCYESARAFERQPSTDEGGGRHFERC